MWGCIRIWSRLWNICDSQNAILCCRALDIWPWQVGAAVTTIIESSQNPSVWIFDFWTDLAFWWGQVEVRCGKKALAWHPDAQPAGFIKGCTLVNVSYGEPLNWSQEIALQQWCNNITYIAITWTILEDLISRGFERTPPRQCVRNTYPQISDASDQVHS